jgi:hypothetical protein
MITPFLKKLLMNHKQVYKFCQWYNNLKQKEEDDSLYLEIKGKLESTKKAVYMVIDEQQKLE